MRPLSLELKGFAAYKEYTTVDFTDVELAAFVGSTGSGKSTIIDAITFALYGSLPRYDKTNLVAPVIHQLANEARVCLTFQLGNSTYTAVRVVRRLQSKTPGKVKATTKEARLERHLSSADSDENTQTQVLAGNVKELDQAVEDLLGLNFSQFTRTVVLPQGAFARFLKDEPAERQKLLRRLLDVEIYAKMGSRSREKAKHAKQKILFLESEKQRHSIEPDALEKAQTALGDIEQFEADGLKLQKQVNQIEQDLSPIRDQVKELDSSLVLLKDITDKPFEYKNFEIGSLVAAFEESQLLVESARREQQEVQPAEYSLLQLHEMQQRHSHYENHFEAAKKLGSELAEAENADKVAQKNLRVSEKAQEAAAAEFNIARAKADSDGWRAQLVVGEPCPVCEQDVSEVPDHVPPEALQELRSVLKKSETTLAQATKSAAASEAGVKAIQKALERESIHVAESEQLLSDALTKTEVEKKLVAAKKNEQKQKELAAKIVAAEKVLIHVQQRLREAEQAEKTQHANFLAFRDSVAVLGPPAIDQQEVSVMAKNLASWATEKVALLTKEREALAGKGKRLAREKKQLVDELQSSAAEAQLELSEFDQLTIVIAEAKSQAQRAIATIENHTAERKRLTSEMRTEQKAVKTAEVLGRHLSAQGFEGWLLAEAMEEIVVRATQRLQTLSSKQYSLELHDRNFQIVDHLNAGERRDVRTLSGGETFLVSLALALALSDSVAELASLDSPRLESIFLDEGFGTLDAETLDIAAGAIEELASNGTMVVIVTHVREMAMRMPVRYEVTKNPSTSTVEKVTA